MKKVALTPFTLVNRHSCRPFSVHSLISVIAYLVLSTFASSLFAASLVTVNGVGYSLEGGKATVTSYAGKSSGVTIPETVEGCPVVAVGQGAFKGNEELSSIVLPASVTVIGKEAFAECPFLGSITFGCTVVPTIAEDAFRNIFEAGTVYFFDQGDGGIELRRYFGEWWQFVPFGGLAGENIFWNYNTRTATLTISGTGVMDSYSAVYGTPWYFTCYQQVRHIIVEEGITYVGGNAFGEMARLVDVSLPSTLTEVGPMAFAGCKKLARVTNYVAVPIPVSSDAFSVYNTLYVPYGTGAAYRAANIWKNFTIEEMAPTYTLGDVNDDGTVDVSDVTALVSLILAADALPATDNLAADMNVDGKIDVSDVSALVSLILGTGE